MRKHTILVLSFLVGSFGLIAQDLYDINNITLIELTFDDSSWDQTMDTHYSNDADERLLASCIINGIPFDSVGVKYKGNSTYDPNNAKNPLNIKLNHVIGNQDYDGWYTLKLSSGDKDPSFVREALSYEILRKYMMAPLSNFAKVYINGSYYGLFTSNESINTKFIEDYFYSESENTLIKCNPEVVFDGGSSLEYMGTDSTSYFESYELKSDYGWNDLVDFTYSLNNNFADAETFLDIDRAIWILAFNNVMVNLDSYTGPFQQNFYLHKDNHDRLNAIPWDLNMSLGSFRMINFGGPGGGPTTIQDLQEMDPFLRLGDDTFPLIDKILSNTRYQKMYIAHCRTMLEENFVNDLYFDRAGTMQDIIYNDYDSDPSKIYSTTEFTSNLTSTITVGGGPGNGPYIGLSELMDERIIYLQSHEAFQKAPPTIGSISTNTALPNSTVNIIAEISNSDYAYLGYRNSIAEPFSKIEMFDDGMHNDGTANDGTYGTNIDVGVSNIQYYIYADNDDAGIFSPQRAEHEYYELAIVGDVVINEVMALNISTQTDQDSEHDDWIEMYNNSNEAIDISGYYLSDDSNELLKWSFPVGTNIEPQDYLIVWADNDLSQDGLHTNFKLSSSGEALFLSNDSGELIEELTFPVQTDDLSFGRFSNGTGSFFYMPPTYNAENIIEPIVTTTDENEKKEGLTIYPNPVNNYFVVNFDPGSEKQILIFNSMGQVIDKKTVRSNTKINTFNWSSGIYFVKTGASTWSKVIKN